jgi:ubiquinone/menaquinone biosynthesis C-methylase UbiE
MAFTQSDVTEFYDSLVFPSRSTDARYPMLASEIIQEGWQVGDFGCGQSLFYEAFKNLSPPPVFMDISHNALRTIDYGLRIRGDLSRIPLQDGGFDAAFCIGVIHHLPDMQPAIAELSRITRKDGMVIIGVYSPGSGGARLKRAYDAINAVIVKKLIFFAAVVMLWAKLRRHFKLSWGDARKRISDLLDTPIVRYVSADHYKQLATQAGLQVVDQRELSSMTILYFRKAATAASHDAAVKSDLNVFRHTGS